VRHITVTCNHFWSSIAWRTTGGLEKLPLPENVAQAEVNNLDILVLIEEKILGL